MQTNQRHAGVSLVEALSLIAMVSIAISLVAVTHGCSGYNKTMANQALCAANVRGLLASMMIYASSAGDAYPIAGDRVATGAAQGFTGPRGTTTAMPGDPAMIGNATASLWILVRDGSVSARSFICPETGDKRDDLTDAGGVPVPLNEAWDFKRRENLSYSALNMYHVGHFQMTPGGSATGHWSAIAPPDMVLLGDNNNADVAGVHTSAPSGAAAASSAHRGRVPMHDNSYNHASMGQNLGFGDGSVRFEVDPYVGPGGDDVFSMQLGGASAPPTLANDAGDLAKSPSLGDAILIPVSGNNGVSLSGLAAVGPGAAAGPRTTPVMLLPLIIFVALVFAIILIVRVTKGRPDDETQMRQRSR